MEQKSARVEYTQNNLTIRFEIWVSRRDHLTSRSLGKILKLEMEMFEMGKMFQGDIADMFEDT